MIQVAINKTCAKVGRYAGVKVSSIAGFVQSDYAITNDWTVEGGFATNTCRNKIDDFVGYSNRRKLQRATALQPAQYLAVKPITALVYLISVRSTTSPTNLKYGQISHKALILLTLRNTTDKVTTPSRAITGNLTTASTLMTRKCLASKPTALVRLPPRALVILTCKPRRTIHNLINPLNTTRTHCLSKKSTINEFLI